MAKITELIPGQVWEDTDGDQREVLAAGPNLFVTQGLIGNRPSGSPFMWSYSRLNEGLALMHRLVRPRQTKYLIIYGLDGKVWPGWTLYSSIEDAQNYSRVQGWKTVAIVPVEFAEGDGLPQ